MAATTTPASAASSSDLDARLPITNGSVTISSGTLPGSLFGDILQAFNQNKPLQLAQAAKSVLTDGITITGTSPFLGSQQGQITATFKRNGDFSITATLSDLNLSTLTTAVSKQLALPGSFNFDLGTTWVTAEHADSALTLTAAASNAKIGEFALKAEKQQGTWGVAAGFEVKTAGIASLPGLSTSPLARFDSFIGLGNLMMVLSSFDDATFDFPDVVSFNGTSFVPSGSIKLPGTGGLKKGFNIFGNLSAATGSQTNKGFQLLAKYLKLKLDGMSATLSVSLPDPMTSSQLFLEVDGINIDNRVTLDGQFGGEFQAGMVGVYFNGTAVASIQSQPVTFLVQVLAAPTGVVLGGSMQTVTPLFFTIDGVRFSIANLGIVIGIDDEGVPSLGFAATLDINKLNISAAVFIDSVNPAGSMLAAALSGFSLLDVASCIAGQKTVPPELQTVLGKFSLTALKAFSLPSTIGASLDGRDYQAIANAFSQHSVAIPSTSANVLLDVNTRGSLWYLTDLTTMTHYTLAAAGNSISVSLEPQLYCAPQQTNIGGLTFPRGFQVQGQVDLGILSGLISIQVKGLTGFIATVALNNPLIIWNANFFAITGANGVGAPFVSLATISQPSIADPVLSKPHVVVSGEVKILGLVVSETYLSVSAQGFIIQILAQPEPWLKLNLNGNVNGLTNMSLGGGITLGVNDTFDLGPLGNIPIVCDVTGSLSLSVGTNTTLGLTVATARFQGAFSFAKWSMTLPVVQLDVTLPSLASIRQTIRQSMIDALHGAWLGDALGWVNAVRSGTIHGVTQVANVLQSQFHQAAADASRVMHAAGMSVSEIASGLHSAYNSSAKDAATAMSAAGIGANDIASGVKSAYNLSAKDAADLMKNTLHLGSDATKAALQAAGYASKDVGDALSSFFGDLGHDLNPLHW